MKDSKIAIVKANSKISPEKMAIAIDEIKSFLPGENCVFVADNFRERDESGRLKVIDVESLVVGRTIKIVIFFSREEAIFWGRNFPILEKVILITDTESSHNDGEISVLNLNHIPQFFIKKDAV